MAVRGNHNFRFMSFLDLIRYLLLLLLPMHARISHTGNWIQGFRLWHHLRSFERDQLFSIQVRLGGVNLNQVKEDVKVWNIEKDGKFPEKSFSSSIDRLWYQGACPFLSRIYIPPAPPKLQTLTCMVDVQNPNSSIIIKIKYDFSNHAVDAHDTVNSWNNHTIVEYER